MKSLLFAVIISVQLAVTEGDRCTECYATYEAAKDATDDDTVKCDALRDVLTCLVNATSSTCTLEASQAAAIGRDFDTFVDCWLMKTCNCQKDFWEIDQTGGDEAECTAALLFYDCLDGKAETACDGTSTSDDLLPFAEATVNGIPSCSRTRKTCGVCTTEYEKEEDDADTPAEKCSVLKTYLTCMEGAAYCPLSATKAAAIGSNYEVIKADCPLTDVCTCQKNYWMTDLTTDDEASCTTVATLKTCLEAVSDTTETGCDDATVAADIKTSQKTSDRRIECSGSGNGNGGAGSRIKVSILVSVLMLITSTLTN